MKQRHVSNNTKLISKENFEDFAIRQLPINNEKE